MIRESAKTINVELSVVLYQLKGWISVIKILFCYVIKFYSKEK